MVGPVGIGGRNPIRIQSMIVADTMDTMAAVAETISLYLAGSEIVRITTPTVKEAENLKNIKAEIQKRGYDIPIVADIHFMPAAAMAAVEYADKVRINPGNFTDRKKFVIIEYNDSQYSEELDRVHDAFKPLVLRARELGRSLRVGTNHGSLSDRIMNRFGDTPQGMVESAIEFIKIAELYNFNDIIVSMKASNTRIMVQAYRMLVDRFNREKMDYPLHLGVTEAGNGQDGRIKSAAGIGALLEDGIGDTIRVSLTEDSIFEIPVARKIADIYNLRQDKNIQNEKQFGTVKKLESDYQNLVNGFAPVRRISDEISFGPVKIGASQMVRTAVRISLPAAGDTDLEGLDLFIGKISENNLEHLESSVRKLRLKYPGSAFVADLDYHNAPLLTKVNLHADAVRIEIDAEDFSEDRLNDFFSAAKGKSIIAALRADGNDAYIINIINLIDFIYSEYDRPGIIFSLTARPGHTLFSITSHHRMLAAYLHSINRSVPAFIEIHDENIDEALYSASIHGGRLLIDGIGDGIFIACADDNAKASLRLQLDLLQATGVRISKAEFISCPSCGRTLFDLQSVTKSIKQKTGHLKGVKIAVMGCIVNGPGEMADADFGYVGAGPDHIHLYRGREIVKKHVPSDSAVDELIGLIRDAGLWADPV